MSNKVLNIDELTRHNTIVCQLCKSNTTFNTCNICNKVICQDCITSFKHRCIKRKSSRVRPASPVIDRKIFEDPIINENNNCCIIH